MNKPKIAWALGGGAARGLAHIGVLQEFDKEGLHCDLMTGTSMGAVIGAIYACGVNPVMIERIVGELSERMIFDIGVPRRGLLHGDRIDMMMRTLTRNGTFADTKMPLGLVAVDLMTSDRVLLREGPLYRAVRASISIPGVFVPQEINGQVLVDGGVLERVPARSAREMGADFVIGVDVGYRGYQHKYPAGIIDILLQSYEVMEWELVKHTVSDADVMICPDLSDINPSSLVDATKAIERGRQAAKNAMPEIREKLENSEK